MKIEELYSCGNPPQLNDKVRVLATNEEGFVAQFLYVCGTQILAIASKDLKIQYFESQDLVLVNPEIDLIKESE